MYNFVGGSHCGIRALVASQLDSQCHTVAVGTAKYIKI